MVSSLRSSHTQASPERSAPAGGACEGRKLPCKCQVTNRAAPAMSSDREILRLDRHTLSGGAVDGVLFQAVAQPVAGDGQDLGGHGLVPIGLFQGIDQEAFLLLVEAEGSG